MTWGRDTDLHEAREQLESFVEAGGTLVDTAASFGNGDSERVLGELLSKVVARSDVVLATKAGISFVDGRPEIDASRKALLDQLDESLDRLATDTVDLWSVHAWDTELPPDEMLAAMEYAVSSGRARYVGVSNFSGWQTGVASAKCGIPVAATEVEYSLVQRGCEREVLPAADALGLGVLAWSPLGRGVLTGKYRRGIPADSRGASSHLSSFVEPYLNDASRHVVDAVCTAADGLSATPLEVALAWVRDRPGVAAPIVGARTATHLDDILASDDLDLPQEIRAALDDVSAISFGYPERVV